MSRYTGPRVRILRALDTELPGLTRKSREMRPHRPGQHGAKNRRRPSGYSMQLREKQKLRYNYGIGERQLRTLYLEARATDGITGDTMLDLLERRLDNVVFRLGYAPTIPAARQLVCHGHVRVRGRRVDIASFRVRVGDEITLSPKALELPPVVASLGARRFPVPSWMQWDDGIRGAKVVASPGARETMLDIDMQLVVEFYAR